MQSSLQKPGIEKKPFVDKALDELRKMGIKTAVATATDMERAGRYLKQIGIFDKFDKIHMWRKWLKMESRHRIFTYMPVRCLGKSLDIALLWKIHEWRTFSGKRRLAHNYGS